MDHDPNFVERFRPVLEAGKDYGNPGIEQQYHFGYGWLKEERLQHATHANMFVLGLGVEPDMSNVDQIVEFGGGTGDMAALTLDMGFKGAYLVYDMSPMSVLQMYWLRYSGHAGEYK